MEQPLQVDLAKAEAPATQVLNSALGGEGPIPQQPAQLPAKPLGAYQATSQISLGDAGQTNTTRSPGVLGEDGKVEALTNVSVLQPADEGFGAWSYVASAFCMFIVVWGFPQSFPIFQSHLSSGEHAKYPNSTVLSLLAPGLQDIEEGILFQVLPKSPKYRQPMVMLGISIMAVSLYLASCANAPWQILLCQGILYGIGGILLNFVHVSIFSEWFEKKKGKAMGIIWLGWRVGGLAFPPICQWLLDIHGYAETLRVLIAPMLALLAPSVILFRGRFATASVVASSARPRVSKRKALESPQVFFYLFVSTLSSLTTNIPIMFIAPFGTDIGVQASDQALALSLRVLTCMIGTYVFGWLSDRGYYRSLMAGSAICTGLVHLLVLGFVKDKVGLFLYAIAIGIANGGYANCLFNIFEAISKDNGELFTTIHSIFSFFSGVSILSVGPVGVALTRLAPQIRPDSFAIGKYAYLIAYATTTNLISGLLSLAHLWVWKS